jgi:hypothetical protein
MKSFYISPITGYYEGDKLDAGDLEVTQRPSPEYVWNVDVWILDPAKEAERVRLVAIDTTISQDNVISNIKTMTNDQYDTWWAANVTNAAQAIGVLKRLVRVVCRRLL